MYKAINHLAPVYLCNMFRMYKPPRELRSSDRLILEIPRTKTVYGDRAFSVLGPRLYNELPQCIIESTTLSIFKKELRKYLMVS